MGSRYSKQILPIGIDVGSGGVRAIQLQSDGQTLSIRAAGKVDTPGHFDSEQEQQDFVAEALSSILKDKGFKGRSAVTCVPGSDIHFKSFRIPKMPPEELRSAALFEAEERFAFGDEDAEYRYIDAGKIRQGQESRQEIIAMGCCGAALREHLGLLIRVGLVCEAVDVAPCAVARCFADEISAAQDQGQAYLFVDIGDQGSRITTTIDQEIVFVKSAKIGGHELNRLAGTTLNLNPDEALQLRRDILSRYADPDGKDISRQQQEIFDSAFSAITPGIEQLGKEIGLCLRYYAVTFRGIRPHELICVGGHSYETPLLKTLTELTGVPAKRGAPFKNIEVGSVFPERLRGDGLVEWTTAVGLSLRGRSATAEQKVAS